MQWPVRVAQQLARQEHRVGLALAHDRVGLRGGGDQPDGARGHAGLAAHLGREPNLVPRLQGDARMRHVSAGGAIHEIHPSIA